MVYRLAAIRDRHGRIQVGRVLRAYGTPLVFDVAFGDVVITALAEAFIEVEEAA